MARGERRRATAQADATGLADFALIGFERFAEAFERELNVDLTVGQIGGGEDNLLANAHFRKGRGGQLELGDAARLHACLVVELLRLRNHQICQGHAKVIFVRRGVDRPSRQK